MRKQKLKLKQWFIQYTNTGSAQ